MRTQPASKRVFTGSQASEAPIATVTPALSSTVTAVSFVMGGPAKL